jgi:hypothetical protein
MRSRGFVGVRLRFTVIMAASQNAGIHFYIPVANGLPARWAQSTSAQTCEQS